jgi:hypothetical protein
MHEFDLKKFPEGFDFTQFYRKEWDEYNKESFPHIMR